MCVWELSALHQKSTTVDARQTIRDWECPHTLVDGWVRGRGGEVQCMQEDFAHACDCPKIPRTVADNYMSVMQKVMVLCFLLLLYLPYKQNIG